MKKILQTRSCSPCHSSYSEPRDDREKPRLLPTSYPSLFRNESALSPVLSCCADDMPRVSEYCSLSRGMLDSVQGRTRVDAGYVDLSVPIVWLEISAPCLFCSTNLGPACKCNRRTASQTWRNRHPSLYLWPGRSKSTDAVACIVRLRHCHCYSRCQCPMLRLPEQQQEENDNGGTSMGVCVSFVVHHD